MTTIGTRIREERMAAAISQSDFAKSLNISQSTLSKWENGTNEPAFSDVVRISDELNISLSRLAGIDEPTVNESKPITNDYLITAVLWLVSILLSPFGIVFDLIAIVYSFKKNLPAFVKTIGILILPFLINHLMSALNLYLQIWFQQ
ncbi:MAG: helix-turn-helix transcriptional regulator [Solobacterium sp.]|nr:helix-turn-helix transcriptional regulator [Solobacterium sp.]